MDLLPIEPESNFFAVRDTPTGSPRIYAGRYGALDAAEQFPPPPVPANNAIPAYSLNGGDGGVTVRDVKAAGIGALIVLALGWFFRRGPQGQRDAW